MTEPVLRRGARVLLVDDAGRVLLFRHVMRPDDPVAFWVPPGGEIEPGEDAAGAAVREVREETGYDVVLGPEIWYRRHVVAWGGVTYDCRERWFLARVPPFDVSAEGWTDLERVTVTDHRWWTLDDLARTTEELVPAALATLLPALLRDGPPESPVDVGV